MNGTIDQARIEKHGRLRDVLQALAPIIGGSEDAREYRSVIEDQIAHEVAERLRDVSQNIDQGEAGQQLRLVTQRRDEARTSHSRKAQAVEQLEAAYATALGAADEQTVLDAERKLADATTDLRALKKRLDFLEERVAVAKQALAAEQRRGRESLAAELRKEAAESLSQSLAEMETLLEDTSFTEALRRFQVASRRQGAFNEASAEHTRFGIVDYRSRGLRFWCLEDLLGAP